MQRAARKKALPAVKSHYYATPQPTTRFCGLLKTPRFHSLDRYFSTDQLWSHELCGFIAAEWLLRKASKYAMIWLLSSGGAETLFSSSILCHFIRHKVRFQPINDSGRIMSGNCHFLPNLLETLILIL